MSEHAIILLAEDDEDHVILIKRAFAQADLRNPLYVVWNGEEAIEYLEGSGKYSNRDEFPLPDLLLLDLKMPRVDGFQVLAWIREHPELKALRTLVLTSSDDLRDVNRAYQLGANSFLVKPIDFQNVVELSRIVQKYWLKESRIPEISRPPTTTRGAKKLGESEDPVKQ